MINTVKSDKSFINIYQYAHPIIITNYHSISIIITFFFFKGNGGDSFWITGNMYDKEIKYKLLKDLSAFNKKFIKYKNPIFNINDDKSKPWIKKSFTNILEEISHELQYKREILYQNIKMLTLPFLTYLLLLKLKKVMIK